MPESPLLFLPRFPARVSCLRSAVEKSRSKGELGSRNQPPLRSFGSQLGETVDHSWTSRLADFHAPELSERGATTPKKPKNNTNEANMLLKTKLCFWKRTQNELKNELKNEPNRGCRRREPMPNSEVARLDGRKPLTWLATLATRSPRERSIDDVCFKPSPASLSRPDSGTGSGGREYKIRRNKARMSMKTNSRGVEEWKS
jgi:hypothetical protein